MVISRSTFPHPKILVVEDDRSIGKMLRLSLGSAGFEITQVSSGTDALRNLGREDNAVDAVILDLGVHDQQGRAVLRSLRDRRARDETAPVWIVMSSLDREEADRSYGPLEGHFVPKPFDPWDLVTLLKGLLENS